MILLQGRGAYLTGVLISGLLDKTAGFRKSWPTRRAALHPSCILPAALAKISRDDGKKAYSKLTGLIGALANGHNSASSTCTWGGTQHAIHGIDGMGRAMARCGDVFIHVAT